MANTREIIKRRKSVANIGKITGTMEMIATSRFKKAHIRSVGSKPYTNAITRLVAALSASNGKIVHPLLEKNDVSNKTLILVLTGNRGLCGAYNSNVLHEAKRQIAEIQKEGGEIELRASGKKAIQYFRFIGQEASAGYTDFDIKTTFADVEVLADEFMDLYRKKEIDAVQVVYTRFISTARFYPEVLDLLPLAALTDPLDQRPYGTFVEDYIFSPEPEEILQELIPTTVRTRLYQCFTDAIVSEQVVRMRSMKAAADNAEQMISNLTRQYNRARQSQITGELLDIMGGVNALG